MRERQRLPCLAALRVTAASAAFGLPSGRARQRSPLQSLRSAGDRPVEFSTFSTLIEASLTGSCIC